MKTLNYACGCRFMVRREVVDAFDGGVENVVVAPNPDLCSDHAEVVQ